MAVGEVSGGCSDAFVAVAFAGGTVLRLLLEYSVMLIVLLR